MFSPSLPLSRCSTPLPDPSLVKPVTTNRLVSFSSNPWCIHSVPLLLAHDPCDSIVQASPACPFVSAVVSLTLCFLLGLQLDFPFSSHSGQFVTSVVHTQNTPSTTPHRYALPTIVRSLNIYYPRHRLTQIKVPRSVLHTPQSGNPISVGIDTDCIANVPISLPRDRRI